MKDIKIALYGQFENDTKVDFTFPGEFNPALNRPEDAWLRTVSDPRDAREFERAERIYALWKSNEGNYFASIVRNMKDTRMGYIMLVLFAGHQVPANGHSLLNALAQLEQSLVNEGLRDRQLVAQLVESIPCDLVPDAVMPTPGVVKSRIKAYRTFGDENELADIMLYPNQADYEPFNRILLVPRGAVAQAPMNYQELTFPIRRTYNVEWPQGVMATKFTISDGEFLDIVYKKPTFSDFTAHELVMPMGSRFFTINGSRLLVKTAEEAQVQFVRRVRLNIVSAKNGNPITDILINGERVTTPEINLSDGDEIDWTIAAQGYRDERIHLSVNSVIQGGYVINAQLKPQSKDLTIIARCDGTPVEGRVSMSVDDRLYPYLTDKRNYEVRIDRRSAAAPVAISSAGRQQAANQKDNSMLKMIGGMAGGFIAGLILGLSFYMLKTCSSDSNIPEVPLQEETEVQNNGTKNNDDAQQPVAGDDGKPSEEEIQQQEQWESEDLRYLKEQDIWSAEGIKSEKYKQLFDMIQMGNCEEIVAHSYCQEPTANLNGIFKSVVRSINSIIDSGNPTSLNACRAKLQEMSISGQCDLTRLDDALKLIVNPNMGSSAGAAASSSRSSNGGANAGSGGNRQQQQQQQQGQQSQQRQPDSQPATSPTGRPTSGVDN